MDINASVDAGGVASALEKAKDVELSASVPLPATFYTDLAYAYIADGRFESADFALRRAPAADAVASAAVEALLQDDWKSALGILRSARSSTVSALAVQAVEKRAVADYLRVYRGSTPADARAAYGVDADAIADATATATQPAVRPSLLDTVTRSSLTLQQPVVRL
jgi:hypothetical protein